eukprot:6189386-Pleurochrysis_carterae.AAC.2
MVKLIMPGVPDKGGSRNNTLVGAVAAVALFSGSRQAGTPGGLLQQAAVHHSRLALEPGTEIVEDGVDCCVQPASLTASSRYESGYSIYEYNKCVKTIPSGGWQCASDGSPEPSVICSPPPGERPVLCRTGGPPPDRHRPCIPDDEATDPP